MMQAFDPEQSAGDRRCIPIFVRGGSVGNDLEFRDRRLMKVIDPWYEGKRFPNQPSEPPPEWMKPTLMGAFMSQDDPKFGTG